MKLPMRRHSLAEQFYKGVLQVGGYAWPLRRGIGTLQFEDGLDGFLLSYIGSRRIVLRRHVAELDV